MAKKKAFSPEILAKSALNEKQVEAREEIGCDGIEYQMLAEDFHDDGRVKDLPGAVALVKKHPLRAIHLPMSFCNIEDPDVAMRFAAAARIAQASYDHQVRRAGDIGELVVEAVNDRGNMKRIKLSDATYVDAAGIKLKAADKKKVMEILADCVLSGKAGGADASYQDDTTDLVRNAAQMNKACAELSKKKPLVILHNELHFDCMGKGDLIRVKTLVEHVLADCPDIVLAIENTTAHRFLQHGSTKLSSGYYDSPVKFCEFLRENAEGAKKRVFTCLDICHAKITEKHMGAVAATIDGCSCGFSLEEFFQLYALTLGLLHFAGYTGSGYGNGHATPFVTDRTSEGVKDELLLGCDEEDARNMDVLREAYKLYGDLDLACPITLEINEKDINDPQGYAASKRALDTVATEIEQAK